MDHPEFFNVYALKDDKLENMLLAVRLRNAQRTINISGAFVSYHIVKHFLWKKGYGATFFYRTRLMSIPVFMGALWYSNIKVYQSHLRQGHVLEYANK